MNHSTPSTLIDDKINELGDWRDKTLAHIRSVIRQVAPEIIEERKWKKPSNAMKGIPVWSYEGIICTGEIYKDKVKLTFVRGALLADSAGLFNASLQGNLRRAIDIYRGHMLDEKAFKALIRAAITLNTQ